MSNLFAFPKSLPAPVSFEKRRPPPFRTRPFVPRRLRASFFALVIIATIALFYRQYHASPSSDNILLYLQGLPQPEGGTDPPRFYGWYNREKQLPQHDLTLSYPQGREGRYIHFANQACCIGWGNVMQGILLESHLAYLSGRTYVFQNYTWEPTDGDFAYYKDNQIPARVPLTALLSGPVAGNPFPPSSGGSPAVMVEYFKKVCPNPTIIDPDEMKDASRGLSAATLFQVWINKLERAEDRCVEIKAHTTQIFDFWLFGDASRLLDIWPSFSKSPIVSHFGWSPLITAALRANARVIHPSLSALTPSSFSPYSRPTPLSGLLALHVRRGDYIEHCLHLANWTSSYTAYNEFPGLPDRFSPTPLSDAQTSEEQARYRAHCFPDIEQIVSRVREVRASLLSSTTLTCLYVMTNGRPEWLRELKVALQEDAERGHSGRWERITTSRDLRLTGEQRHNGQAIDMAIGQRAEVFLGNGFSSLTSNVVMLRAAQRFPWDKTRFW